MTKPIRILHVIGIMNRGGAEAMIMNLYRNIDRSVVQFDFVENSYEPAAFDEEIRSLGGIIYRCPHYNSKNHLSYTRWWNQFFQAHTGEYPIVHGHIGSAAAIYLSIAKKYGCFTIAHSHSTGDNLIYRVFSYPTRYIADYFFGCSEDAGISRYGKRIVTGSNKFVVLNNAIDASQFAYNSESRANMRSILGIAEGVPVIGHVGRFTEAKNHVYLLDIFESIHAQTPSAVLLLVGDGNLRPQIEKIIDNKSLRENVILAGVQNNVWDYYQAMDVFMMPSLYEGLPVSMVEAQTAGLPCIVSSNVPQESAITDLVSFLSLSDSPQQWADFALAQVSKPRSNMLETIKSVGYDIASTSQWLTNFYCNVVANREK